MSNNQLALKSSTKKPLDCRAAAAKCLAAIEAGASLNQQLPIFEERVKERDRSLYRQLCYGTLRFFPQLMAIAAQLIKKPLKTKDRDVLMLVLLGAYQMTDTRIPEHAAVSATVNATKDLKKPWAKALINGVLRQWQRQQPSLIKNLDEAAKVAHPQWLFDAINQAWPDRAASIMEQNNHPAPMCLRINQQHTSRNEYLVLLEEARIEAQPCSYAEQGIRLVSAIAVDKLPHFSAGWVSVQDEAAQLCAPLLSLEPGLRVLDACSAPGGKTCHILEAEPNLEEVIALDINQDRLKRVEENLGRLQLCAQLVAGDAADTDSWWDGRLFDRILLDAPCSATGVIRRNPDIKLHRTAEDIEKLVILQNRILKALWSTLKPGGHLLYATCSILPEENQQQISSFCQQQMDAEHVNFAADWGLSCDYGRQLFPQAMGHDGFFYALIKKNP